MSDPAQNLLLSIAVRIANASSKKEIYAILVNELQPSFSFLQAAIIKKDVFGFQNILGINGLVIIEHSGPFPVWLRRLGSKILFSKTVRTFDPSMQENPGNWEKFAATYLLVVPLAESYLSTSCLFLFREREWSEAEQQIAKIISDIATGALSRFWIENSEKKKRNRAGLIIAVICFGLSIIPVELTSIAPAEIVPSDPYLIAPSFPAVVKKILISSNENVAKDQILVDLDDSEQQAKVNVLKREVEIAEADLRKYSQLGFQDQNSRYRLSEAEGQLKIKRLQLQKANLDLDKTKLRSPIPGIAIVSDPLDWVGKPVQTGEKILLVAKPNYNSARLWVPVTDGAILKEGLTGYFYVDSDPWTARRIIVKNWSFEPELSPQGIIAFRVKAENVDQKWSNEPLGLHGVAHLAGKRLPLALYLLRKPIIFLRQTFAI